MLVALPGAGFLAATAKISSRIAGRCSMCSLPIATARKRKRMETVEVRDAVTLSDDEVRIFDKLLAAGRAMKLGTQLRVAGGWVRDKLLGKDCYDIDIAVDNMYGREFCEKLNEYLKSIGDDTRNVAVIVSNPEQSKHLETARMKLGEIWVDFVNLRTETYADASRIPTMEFGTPKQDAERRDLTINSLFYNLNTREVEDHTGRGLRDLRAGVIATPLEPKVTFLDDPLRVLRAVRFASRFGFELEDDLKTAAALDEVRNALKEKIKKERVGHEIELMLLGSDPTYSMALLLDLNLFPTVFILPENLKTPLPDDWERVCVQHIQAAWDVLERVDVKLPADQKLKFLLAAVLFPLRDCTYEGKKRKEFPATSLIIRESLKLKNTDSDGVSDLHRSARNFARLAQILLSDADEAATSHAAAATKEEFQRLETGLQLLEIKELWRAALVLSSIIDLQNWDTQEKAKICTSVMEFITNQGLEECWKTKPLLDGKEIMEEFGLKGGPAVKRLKELSIQWQLAHPSGTAAACREWLKQQPRETK